MDTGKIKFGVNNAFRECVVSYFDEPEYRVAAIAVFNRHRKCLWQGPEIPKECFEMSQVEAQQYFDKHPIRRRCDVLTVLDSDSISDIDLANLKQLPELKILRLISNKISDKAVPYISVLEGLEILDLYSEAITDNSVDHLVKLRSLKTLDLQGSINITRFGVSRIKNEMPFLNKFYPPQNLNP